MSYLVEQSLAMTCQVTHKDNRAIDQASNLLAFILLEQFTEHSLTLESDTGSELQRLDMKLNLIMHLLMKMQSAGKPQPAPRMVRLGADFISWQQEQARAGEHYRIELFLSETLSTPIQAIVTVSEISDGWCSGHFVGQTAEERQAWEKWVFRLHRRAVASSRHTK